MRSLDFINLPWVNVLEWARLPGDALFILGGALPLVWLCWQALRYPNPRRIEAETECPDARDRQRHSDRSYVAWKSFYRFAECDERISHRES
jgi:hypothetical protein